MFCRASFFVRRTYCLEQFAVQPYILRYMQLICLEVLNVVVNTLHRFIHDKIDNFSRMLLAGRLNLVLLVRCFGVIDKFV